MIKKPAPIFEDIDALKAYLAEKNEQFQNSHPMYEEHHLLTGVVTGCFDTPHLKHADVVADAKSNCELLVVALSPDSSIKPRKGEERPFFSARERAEWIASHTDATAVFLAPEGEKDIRQLWQNVWAKLKPDIVCIGEDRKNADLALPEGCKLVHVGSNSSLSTTIIAKRILEKSQNTPDIMPSGR